MPPAAEAQTGNVNDFSVAARQAAGAHGYSLDSAQIAACGVLDRLFSHIVDCERNGNSLLRLFQRKEPVRGVYLWGGVGRGKSFLMDSFFDAVPIARKRRQHFHRFMQFVHSRLARLQGAADPLRIVGRDTAREVRLLCLDEIHISDIGDAMIMGKLLQSLLENGIALVTTSNFHPDRLYEHGLQRARFIPAIDLLKQRMSIVAIDAGIDYRLAVLEKAGVFHWPADERAERALARTFEDVTGSFGVEGEILEICSRAVKSIRIALGAGWFEFGELCEGPRGQADYIELARRFQTVLISRVPRFSDLEPDRRRRFSWLVDEFYDRRVKLIVSAETSIDAMFSESSNSPEVQRTQSRLIEMQTRRYLSEAHLA